MKDPTSSVLALPVPVLLMISVAVTSVLGWLVKPLQQALLLSPWRVRERKQVHRLLTAGWVHKDIAHLAFNLIALYFFAEPVLKVMGTTRFLVLYVSAVVMAFVPTTLRHMYNPKYASLGASGAVTAVMFGAILLNPKMKLYIMPVPFPVPAALFAVGYVVYSVWHSYKAGDDVNHDAHISGAIYGALFTYVFESARVHQAFKGLL